MSTHKSLVLDEERYLAHYGIVRRSGRYPWGSGKDPGQRGRDFQSLVNELKASGMSEKEIAVSLNLSNNPDRPQDASSSDLRAALSIAKNAVRQSNITSAQVLQDKGYSNGAIAERMGLPGESSVRALLAEGAKDRANRLEVTAKMLKDEVDGRGVPLDVGVGVEHHLNMTRSQLDTALKIAESEGYAVHKVQIDQLGTGNKTTVKVIAPPGTTYVDIVKNPENIQLLNMTSPNGKEFTSKAMPPMSLDSKRVGVKYDEDGGGKADGVIYVRPGVDDVSLGGGKYAQVRVLVDGTHYIKGMAVYSNDLPKGVDVLFNTNKSDTGNKLDALKKVEDDPLNPFKTQTVQIKSPDGKKVTSVMNKVNEEGDWDNWNKSLATQFLSKQKPGLAKEQLDKTFKNKRDELDEILALTNPAVKKKLLESYADDVDSSSVHLKAASLPRQATQVILPMNSLKDTEVYAPNFKDGERVVLVRYPHGGKFEIPELVVNNRNPEGSKTIGKDARDAIGINSKVAERLSGADFDGDTVLVIPNNSGKIKSEPALKLLKNFDPKKAYPAYEGMPRMTGNQKQQEMGKVSNLITDMTIKGANNDEIARAVRHSMVVIDAEKHNLNYKESAIRNGIPQLKAKYQGVDAKGKPKGSSTLISKTTSDEYVDYRKQSYAIDPKTGEKIYNYTGEGYTNAKGKFIARQTKSTKGAEAKDAHTLSSGTKMEEIYADHSNRLKGLGNEARRALVSTKSTPYSPSAKKVYAKEVAQLNDALKLALRNAPIERQAQVLGNALFKSRKEANPQWDADDIKKARGKALVEARERTGAGKNLIDVTPRQWEAIQSGAISTNQLNNILNNTNLDRIKELATPRQNTVMTNAAYARARNLLASGKSTAEVAEILGVNVNTLKSSVYTENGTKN